jgi:photosystem II stability/assembly factor-like uncharacterized protein
MKKITSFLFALLFTGFTYSQTVQTLSMFMDIDAFKTDSNIIYVSTLGMGIMKSTDAGNSWFSASSGIENKDVFSAKVSPQDPNQVLATVWNNCCGVGGFLGIYKSTDGGNNWNFSNTGINGSANLFRIVYDPGSPNIVYVAGYFGALYKSTDGGDNWINLSYPGGDINGIIVQPNGTLWCGGWNGLRKSTDQGSTWQTITGLPGGVWNLVYIESPINDTNILYITLHYSDYQKVIYKTTDNGSSWTQIAQQINGGYLIGIGENDNLLVVGSKSGLFLSPDGGNNWNPIDTNNVFLAHNGVISNNVLYLISGGGVSSVRPITTSIGESFEIVPLKFSLSQNYPNPFNPSTVIEFTLSTPETVTINIYDINGQLIRNLFNDALVTGAYTTRWEGTDNFGKRVASGTYFYRIEAGNSFDVKKMILIK